MFSPSDLELILWTAERFGTLGRRELAQTICENLPWKAPNGQLRVQACLPLLEELEAAGMIRLAPKRKRAERGPDRPRAQALLQNEITATLRQLHPVRVEPVPADERAVWNATVAQEHPLGFRQAFGAHQRYWIRGEFGGQPVILGALLFAAAAKDVAVRDAWLGWTRPQQQRFRQRIVANSRFLILPGVRVPHLASHALSLALRRLPRDWRERYGYEPVVVETFVSPPWRGTCYRAANWVHLGQSTGRGRQDRAYAAGGTVREVFVYPLVPNWREALVAEPSSSVPEAAATWQPTAPGTPAGGGKPVLTAEQTLNEMTEARIKQRYEMVRPFLDEKQRRLLAGAEAIAYGSGGLRRVAALLGMGKDTVGRGMHELRHPEAVEIEGVRSKGGGRKPTVETDPELLADLDRLISPTTRGHPESALRWTCKSTRKLAEELNALSEGRSVGEHLVRGLLHQLGYSLQAPRKTLEGKQHPDRDAQFEHINATVEYYQQQGQPVISVDTKKKELVGDFKNVGREWQPEGQPERVRTHDFQIKDLGKVSPYGIYDLARNEGWVNVGTDHDTATFAVASIRGWWQTTGRGAYPKATHLLITADGGGSNSARSRLWKVELQTLADETGLSLAVSHFPPATSKWNKVEHRLFAHITQNWRGRALESHEVIVNLIANTTTATGLKVRCQLDTTPYPTGVSVSDAELATVQIERSTFHGEWNYVIRPHSTS